MDAEHLGSDLEKVLIDESALENRLRELAAQVDADYADRNVLLVGVLKPNAGGVYLDGHSTYLWERGSFGAMVGYLPQSVSLLNGTIAFRAP